MILKVTLLKMVRDLCFPTIILDETKLLFSTLKLTCSKDFSGLVCTPMDFIAPINNFRYSFLLQVSDFEFFFCPKIFAQIEQVWFCLLKNLQVSLKGNLNCVGAYVIKKRDFAQGKNAWSTENSPADV